MLGEPELLDAVIELIGSVDVAKAAEGKLTPSQCARYDALSALVVRYRPILDRLLADEPPLSTSNQAEAKRMSPIVITTPRQRIYGSRNLTMRSLNASLM